MVYVGVDFWMSSVIVAYYSTLFIVDDSNSDKCLKLLHK
jgi:hypothetical protein